PSWRHYYGRDISARPANGRIACAQHRELASHLRVFKLIPIIRLLQFAVKGDAVFYTRQLYYLRAHEQGYVPAAYDCDQWLRLYSGGVEQERTAGDLLLLFPAVQPQESGLLLTEELLQ
ncbi:MAG: hypothetical protein IKI24_05350, partial [Clostridia bacterium]|nr:hypothetical protein [Clostridia bacterium]